MTDSLCTYCVINSFKAFFWILSALYIYVTDIFKMCMKKFDIEKIILTK